MNKNFFNHRHPLVASSYYIVVLLIVMSTTNPIVIGSCFIGSFCFRLIQLKGRQFIRSFGFPFFFLIAITLTNPLFVHRGGTILFFFFGKPFTLEALVYGLHMGIMIATVLFLFQSLQVVVDSEKFFYLFGKRFAKLSLILTMIFRFIPLFQHYFQELRQVQKTMDRTQQRSLKEKADYGLDLFGNLFSWALENAMDTADSMKARGYGSYQRSSRISYRWSWVDTVCLFGVLGMLSIFLISLAKGVYLFNYYPYTESITLLFENHWLNYGLIFLFALLPTINSVREGIIWTILKSKI